MSGTACIGTTDKKISTFISSCLLKDLKDKPVQTATSMQSRCVAEHLKLLRIT
jgi:hypothetical protein